MYTVGKSISGKEASPATSRQSGRLKKEKYPLSGDNKQREAGMTFLFLI